MTLSILPVKTGSEFYRFTIDLTDKSFIVEMYYNTRDIAWFMSLLLVDETPVFLGKRVVVDMPLTIRLASSDRPVGEIFALDRDGTGIPAMLEDLANRVLMAYEDET